MTDEAPKPEQVIKEDFEMWQKTAKEAGQSTLNVLTWAMMRNLDLLVRQNNVIIELLQQKNDGIITPGEFNPKAWSLKP